MTPSKLPPPNSAPSDDTAPAQPSSVSNSGEPISLGPISSGPNEAKLPSASQGSSPAGDATGSSTGGVVAVIRRESAFLVIQRGLKIPRAPGMFCFPGGSIEVGESPLEALQREMQEELGIEIEPLGKIWNCQTPRGVPLEWWAAELNSTATLRPCPIEVAWHGWLEIEQILALEQLLPTNQVFLQQLLAGQIQWPARATD